jgi:hypothetical protein
MTLNSGIAEFSSSIPEAFVRALKTKSEGGGKSGFRSGVLSKFFVFPIRSASSAAAIPQRLD